MLQHSTITGTMPSSRPHLLSLWTAPHRGAALLPAASPSKRSLVCRSQSARKPKDPKAWGSIDELRADLEKGESGFGKLTMPSDCHVAFWRAQRQLAAFETLQHPLNILSTAVTGLINWLSQAATSASDAASSFDLKAAYRTLMSRRRGVATKSWDEELAELDELEVSWHRRVA